MSFRHIWTILFFLLRISLLYLYLINVIRYRCKHVRNKTNQSFLPWVMQARGIGGGGGGMGQGVAPYHDPPTHFFSQQTFFFNWLYKTFWWDVNNWSERKEINVKLEIEVTRGLSRYLLIYRMNINEVKASKYFWIQSSIFKSLSFFNNTWTLLN